MKEIRIEYGKEQEFMKIAGIGYVGLSLAVLYPCFARVSKEFVFSGLNNLEVVTTTPDKYEVPFGFTEKEVFAALEDPKLGNEKAEAKQ